MPRRLGFLDGLRAFFGGIGFVLFRPKMWGWAAIPIFVATLLFGATGALAIWGGASLADQVLSGATSGWAAAGLWGLRVLFWIVGLLLAFLLALTLAQPLSGFALDAIARRQELALGGRTWPDQPLFPSLFRSLRVTLFALAVSLPLLLLLSVVTLLFPPASVVTVPLKLAVAGFAISYDFLDYPLGLRGEEVGARAAFLRRHAAAVLGFGLAASVVLLVPGLGLLLLPFGVAGATRLVVLADRP
ncbi:MAG: EI24 domain-containing protein [Labilithrix sp.]|nr:EI24 domain-containing protein [Labilithrix sp.]MCW5812876.1 EI24 domain-containing protein [Labilithrix sp.]